MHLRDLTQYLRELADNNNRPWFIMNKPRYDILREEFLAVVTQMIAELGKFDPQVKFSNPKKAMFRINRDVRFAHDKSPYKTRFSAAACIRRRRTACGRCRRSAYSKSARQPCWDGACRWAPPPPRSASCTGSCPAPSARRG